MIIPNQYPTLTKENAEQCLNLYMRGDLTPQIISSKTTGAFTEKSNTQEVEETILRLWEIVEEVELDGGLNAQAYHSKASVELHKGFVNLGAATRDPDFWRWVTFFPAAEGAALIDLRYGNSDIPGSAKDKGYYIGRINQGLLSTLWLRAEITHDPEHSDDPYHLCKAIDDIEFWVSHIVRINFSSCRAVAQAFVKFVVDSNMPRGVTSDPNNTGFRDLAPELKRRFATISFETMDTNDAYKFIEKVWDDRQSWKNIN